MLLLGGGVPAFLFELNKELHGGKIGVCFGLDAFGGKVGGRVNDRVPVFLR